MSHYVGDINPFNTTKRLKRHQNKVKVEGFCLNILYLAWFFFVFFMFLWKNSISFLKKKSLQTYLCCIKTEVAIKFLKKTFSAKNRLGTERVKNNQRSTHWDFYAIKQLSSKHLTNTAFLFLRGICYSTGKREIWKKK